MKAFDLDTLIEHLPSGNIRSLASYDEKLFIGTSDGCVLLYRLELHDTAASGSGSGSNATLESYLELKKSMGHGKRAVEQLHVIPELNQLLVLCDSTIFTVDMVSLEETEAIQTKGVVRFCMEEKGPLYRLAIAMKKRIQLYEFIGSYVLYKELAIPDTALSMAWSDDTLIVGYKREYSLINVNSNKPRELFPIEKGHKQPLVRLLPDGELLVSLTMGTEYLGMFVALDGTARRQNLLWSQQPLSVTHVPPYIVTLLPKSIEVHNMYDQELLQTVPFSGGTAMLLHKVDPHSSSTVAASTSGTIFAATPNKVSVVTPMPIDRQVSDLLQARRIQEALDLVERQGASSSGGGGQNQHNGRGLSEGDPDSVESKLLALHTQAGFALLADLEFGEAAEHFNQSNVSALDVVSLFDGALPPTCAYALNKSKNSKTDATHTQLPDGSSTTLSTLIRTKDPAGNVQLEVKRAASALLPFLYSKRVINENADENDNLDDEDTLLDTAIFRMLAVVDQDEAMSFIQNANNVLLDGTIEYLTALPGSESESGSENYAGRMLKAQLYISKGMTSKALDIWKELGMMKQKRTDVVQECIAESIKALSVCSDPDIVWKYSPWLLDIAPEDAVVIFTGGSDEVSVGEARIKLLKPPDVLECLASYDGSDSLGLKYLEKLVIGQGVDDESLHTQLALKYLDTVLMLSSTAPSSSTFLPGQESGLLGDIRTRLLKFLESSQHINIPAVLGYVRDSGLHHECALLYARLGQHELGLRRLVYDLKDFDAAEAYCLKVIRKKEQEMELKVQREKGKGKGDAGVPSSTSTSGNVFLTLLDVALHPPGGRSLSPKMLEYAVKLLDKHSAILNPTAVLGLLPSTLPLSAISSYLEQSLPASLHTHRDHQISAAIARQENIQARVQLISAVRGGVVVTKELSCPVCGKRIGDKVFARFPDGSVVHFNCLKQNEKGERDRHVNPSTQVDFSAFGAE